MSSTDELIQNVIDTMDTAKTQRINLTELLDSLHQGINQVKESASASRQKVQQHFADIEKAVCGMLSQRMGELLRSVDGLEKSHLDPLLQCEEMITQSLTEAAQCMENGGTVLANSPEDNIEALVQFKNSTDSHSLNILPEVPSLSEVAYIEVEFLDSLVEKMQGAVGAEGKLYDRAPIQITEVHSCPGGVMVKWEEVDDDVEAGEFRLQYCYGQASAVDSSSKTFHTAYTGTNTKHVVKHLRTNTSYSFRVCCRADKGSPWSMWSVPKIASTSIPHYEPPADKNEALLKAYNYVHETGQSVRNAARKFSVPEATLRSRVHNPRLLNAKTGRPPVMAEEMESQLATHCERLAQIGYNFGRAQVLEMASNMVTAAGGQYSLKKDWYYGLVKRFPAVGRLKGKKSKEIMKQKVDRYISEFEKLLDEMQVTADKPELIWNMAETSLKVDDAEQLLIGNKIGESVNATVMLCGSVVGDTVPPYIVFRGGKVTTDLTRGCYPQTKFAATSMGRFSPKVLKDFIENHFIEHVKCRPCLLLYDGYSTSFTVDLIEHARQNDIHMFPLPPCSPNGQIRTDEEIFSHFQHAVGHECQKYLEIGHEISMQDLSGLIAGAYYSSVTKANVIKGFQAANVLPRSLQSRIFTSKQRAGSKRKCQSESKTVQGKLKRNRNKKSSDFELESSSSDGEEEEHGEEDQAGNLDVNTVMDHSEAGPSSTMTEIVSFYDTETGNDGAGGGAGGLSELCGVCGLDVPAELEGAARGRDGIIRWAKCDGCGSWVHLKYCTPVVRVTEGERFVCPRC